MERRDHRLQSGDIAVDSARIFNTSSGLFLMADAVDLTDASSGLDIIIRQRRNSRSRAWALRSNSLDVDFTEGSGGTLKIELKQVSGTEYDQLNITGTPPRRHPRGSAADRLLASVSDVFTILTASSVSGTFATWTPALCHAAVPAALYEARTSDPLPLHSTATHRPPRSVQPGDYPGRSANVGRPRAIGAERRAPRTGLRLRHAE